PLLICAAELEQQPDIGFYDPASLKRLDLPLDASAFAALTPSVSARASANGRLFTVQPELRTAQMLAYVVEGNKVQRFAGKEGTSPVPGADGQNVFSSQAVLTGQLKVLPTDNMPDMQGIPSASGRYYLKFVDARPGQPRTRFQNGVPVFHLDRKNPVGFVRLDHIDDPRLPNRPSMPFDKRVHFLP